MNLPQSVQLIQSNGLKMLLVYDLSVNQTLTKRNPPLTERLFNFRLKPIYDNTNAFTATTWASMELLLTPSLTKSLIALAENC